MNQKVEKKIHVLKNVNVKALEGDKWRKNYLTNKKSYDFRSTSNIITSLIKKGEGEKNSATFQRTEWIFVFS